MTKSADGKLITYARRVAMFLATALLLAAVGLNVYVMACGFRGRAAVIGGRCVMRVETGSMQPSISAGDFIVTKKIPAEQLEVGDIISFYSQDREIYGLINTHRIVERVPDGFITKGDANENADGMIVREERIIGKYVGKVRFLRWLGSFASARKLVLLAVILLTAGMAFYEIVTISKIKTEIDQFNDAEAAEEKERLIRAAIDEEKQRLYAENFGVQDVVETASEVTQAEVEVETPEEIVEVEVAVEVPDEAAVDESAVEVPDEAAVDESAVEVPTEAAVEAPARKAAPKKSQPRKNKSKKKKSRRRR